ncbi:helix-turn-helix domain-containing protein [Leptospira sp. 2 VSF17]|uniref:Helix-turn-helix domain-containing protein n=1 Tax=Leptospira soteropolitanensis TaxID=2950025 RepID=A0AAW5VPZ3_9LEPT|nr:helix-turn-helix domain-containing protein [Leptospira soteropolitanensis]MCW7502239.1 helix-turn-helix domain-containing protein [Leptospira soteropolitanensis]MCW7532200.1 helix-turn-helix domain-containing protein [Leptospira soteropolitanensis]
MPVNLSFCCTYWLNLLILGSSIIEIMHATSFELAYRYHKQLRIDLFILDLSLFGADGFHFLEKFPNERSNTIIVSAYNDLAIRAFEYGVLDYLTKPISEERLRLSLQRFFIRSNRKGKLNTSPIRIKTRLSKVDIHKLDVRLTDLMEVKKVYQNENLSLKSLAEELDLHPRQLSEFLNEKKHKTFTSFLHNYRIKEAKYLLERYPEKKISDIGFEVGYKSLSNFYDAFKKELKITASEYRQKNFISTISSNIAEPKNYINV